jgi:ubiquinone/menaquinone biosynthesis C-methylase UbiE
MTNFKTFSSNSSVKLYSVQDQLQKPEATILNILKDRLFDMRMLDLGVGGGRTSLHFANLCKEYIGADYAESMIKSCRERFADLEEKIDFKCCDARSMPEFDNEYFDFVLFSFNGIDYVTHNDRIKALLEIKRICRMNGFFAFSSHNVQFIDQFYKIKLSWDLKTMFRNLIKYSLIILTNGSSSKYINARYTIFNDGAFRFGLKTYYIKPEEQIKQLEESGFRNIQVFSIVNGEEIPRRNLTALKDSWVYYFCQK